MSISPCQTVVGPVGIEPTTRGLKGAGTQCVKVRVRLTGVMIGHDRVPESCAVAVSAAVKAARIGSALAVSGLTLTWGWGLSRWDLPAGRKVGAGRRTRVSTPATPDIWCRLTAEKTDCSVLTAKESPRCNSCDARNSVKLRC